MTDFRPADLDNCAKSLDDLAVFQSESEHLCPDAPDMWGCRYWSETGNYHLLYPPEMRGRINLGRPANGLPAGEQSDDARQGWTPNKWPRLPSCSLQMRPNSAPQKEGKKSSVTSRTYDASARWPGSATFALFQIGAATYSDTVFAARISAQPASLDRVADEDHRGRQA